MKKSLFVFLLLAAILLFCSISLSHSQWTTVQITNNSYDDYISNINNNGYIVWRGKDFSEGEIFLYDGTNTTQITNNSYQDTMPEINDNGHIVWRGSDGHDPEIFLYDGANIAQITDNSHSDSWPKINDNGYVVWQGHDGSDWEIFLYDGTNTTQITNNSYDDTDPQINNNGYVVWRGYDGTDWGIFLYDGTNTTQLTKNYYQIFNPEINNNGYVVWHTYDGSSNEIFLYDGTNTTQITNDSNNDYEPKINNNGYVAWTTLGGLGYQIFLYDGTSITKIIDVGSGYPSGLDDINDNGYLVWTQDVIEWGGNFEIFVYDGTNITQITDNPYTDYNPRINNSGYVAWRREVGSDWEIFLSKPSFPGLRILTPNGGEIIPSGSGYTIEWEAAEEVETFKLKYSMDNGATWEKIADDILGMIYPWEVPTPKKNKANCLIKAIGYDASGKKVGKDTSDDPFTIEVLTVTSPTEGDTLTSDETHTITWTTNETKAEVAKVKLLYTKNGGKTWKKIDTIEGYDPETYIWTVPDVPTIKSKCRVKVVLKDENGKTVAKAISDGYFTIQP